MKAYKTIHFTSVILIVISIFMLYTVPISAQSQIRKQPASSSNQSQTSIESNDKQNNASGTPNKMTAIPITDEIFIKTVSESNLAEIELSDMALQKASSENVRAYAQMLIKHHTAAQLELSSAMSQSIAMKATQKSAGGTSNDANDETGIESSNNDADKTATLGGTGGTTGNSMATGKTNGQYNSNIDTGKSGKAASQAGTAKDTSAPVSRDASSTTGAANQNPSLQKGYLTTELSAEHKALKNKLSVLSGAAFDRQYLQAMVEDHAKAIELFEKQALQSKDTNLQSFASKNLPLIKEHYQMAQKLSNK